MADVTSTLNSWSSTSSSNLPANSAAVGPNTLADNQRVIQAVVRAAVAGDGTIASAATTDLSTVNDGDITVTGTTTITGLGTLTAGVKKVLTFSGSLILTHNSTSLILPGAANITTAAGDVAVMRSLGSGNWKCIAFQPAAGNSKSGANADITSMTALTAPTVAANPIRATDLQVQLATRFTAGGTADAMTGTLSPAITIYTAGLRVTTTPPGANTIIGPTLSLNALGVKMIKKKDTSGAKVALVAGNYNASGPFDYEYDGTDFVLLNPLNPSSSYIPTLFNTTNVAASTAYDTLYVRTGNVVNMFGAVSIDPTTTGTTVLGMSLPIASNFTGSAQAGGTFSTTLTGAQSGSICADATNDRLFFGYNATDTSNTLFAFNVAYVIV